MKDYNEKTHLYGRFWVISALFIFLMLPVAISAHLHAFPSAQVVFKGLAPIALLFYPTAVIEVMTYTPLLGTGATYLAFVTGNINNLKLPCVLSALDSAQVRAQSKEGRGALHHCLRHILYCDHPGDCRRGAAVQSGAAVLDK